MTFVVAPPTMDVVDKHGGFTALVPTGTLWRPARGRNTVGKLVDVDVNAFWQLHRGAVLAGYKLPGYRYRVGVWFCPRTGKRLDDQSFPSLPREGECGCEETNGEA